MPMTDGLIYILEIIILYLTRKVGILNNYSTVFWKHIG